MRARPLSRSARRGWLDEEGAASLLRRAAAPCHILRARLHSLRFGFFVAGVTPKAVGALPPNRVASLRPAPHHLSLALPFAPSPSVAHYVAAGALPCTPSMPRKTWRRDRNVHLVRPPHAWRSQSLQDTTPHTSFDPTRIAPLPRVHDCGPPLKGGWVGLRSLLAVWFLARRLCMRRVVRTSALVIGDL